ncbi:MAG: PAS domain S-box protein [Deltaproteobacteria bacterium]|nr:PAS domain S-box protein [Deltaproteobacteria bacterium]
MTNRKDKNEPGKELKGMIGQLHPYSSPMQILIIMALSIFGAEVVIMLIFFTFGELEEPVRVILDPVLLVLLLSPILYFFLFRPLITLIYERSQAEEGLIKERDRAHQYLDIAGVMLVVLNTEGKVTLINKRGAEMLGYNENEILGKDWFENFVPADIREKVLQTFYKLIKGEEPPVEGYFENRILTRTGDEKIILFHNTVLKEGGSITGTLSSGEDITQRKKVEKALKESEARYRLIHNTAFDGIIVANINDIIIDCNTSAEKIFGYTRNELIGMELSNLMPEDYRARHRMGMQRFLETGSSRNFGKILEFEGLRKNGEKFPLELVLGSFMLKGVVNFTGMMRDITERKRAEKEHERIQARLSQSQKMEAIGRFAGGIAHDFNNILTAIRGNAELAIEDVDKSDPLYERLDGIILSVMLASKLTRQLLLFSRGQPFELITLNINKTVESLLVMINRLIGEDITISTELAPDLWNIRADEGNIEQVIMNLAVNARDAMPQGGKLFFKTENVELSEADIKGITEAHPGKAIRLTVRDTGTGMDRETVQRIFEPFFTTKGSEKGTGFGLAVVYGIVKQHGGWVTVSSELGKGTTFKIYMPAHTESSGRTEGTVEAAAKPDGAGEKILLVDAEDRVRGITGAELSEHGYKVLSASNAKEAQEIFDSEHGAIDLLMTDIILSDKNGIQLADNLRSKKTGIQVILTSSYMDLKTQFPSIGQKGYKYLQKPYSLTGLLRAVKDSIEGSRMKQ